MLANFRHNLQNKFLAGMVIVVPIGITVVLLVMMFTWLDGLFAPFALRLTHRQIPGLGIASTILIIFGVGLLVTNMVGRAFVGFGEALVAKIPFVRNVYAGAKQFLAMLTLEERKPFTRVVRFEYPQKGNYTIGFITTEASGEIQEKIPGNLVNVFVSTLPNPTTGFLLLVPRNELTMLPLTVEEGMKIVISGGIVYPSGQASPPNSTAAELPVQSQTATITHDS